MRRLPDLAYRLIGRFSVTRFDRFLHPLLYRWAGGRGITGHLLGTDNVLLMTTGRRTGRTRTVALLAVGVDGGAWVVIGSRGGSGHVPGWAHNLRANPRAAVQAGRRVADVVARELSGEDYEWAFELAADTYPGYRLYRRNARHHIPIFRLEPA